IVGTMKAPASLMALAAPSRIRLPCSIERTPASMARRTAESLYACESTYLPTAWASSTAARISATVYCVVSSSSDGDMAPPEAMILIWSTSRRSCSRAALRTSSTPSAMEPTMPTQQPTGSIHSARRRLSPWASVSPGISVAPLQSSVVTGPGSAPTVPWRATSLMVSSSTTTAAPSTGSAPVQSITNALVKTVMLIARLFPVALPRHDLGVVHPHLLVGARRPLHRAGHAVEVVLLPEEDPRRLVVDELLQLGVGGRTALGIHHRDGAGDLLVDHLVVDRKSVV